MKTKFVGMLAAPALLGGLRTLLALAVACVVLAVSVCAMSSSSATAATVYTVDLPPTGDLTLTGTITTDGNLGIITRADILDWDVTVYSASLSAGFEFTPLTSTLTSYSAGGRSPYGAIATATTLTLPSTDYVFDLEKLPVGGIRFADPYGQAVVDGAGSEYFRVETTDGRYDEVQIGLNFPLQLANAGVTSSDNNDQGGNNNDQGGNNNYQGNNLSQVSLPATLPLFATGLGALGLIGWCRKRKA